MEDRWAQSENERVTSNMIRLGVVSALDEASARIKVTAGGVETDWIPWAASRAGATRVWSAPRIGEQMMVLSPYGDMAQAVAVGGIFQTDHPAPASSKDNERTIYPDGTTIDYDSANNTLTVTVLGNGKVIVNCKEATINATTKVELNTPTVHATGDILADGDVKAGSISLKTHKHGDVQAGGSQTGTPV